MMMFAFSAAVLLALTGSDPDVQAPRARPTAAPVQDAKDPAMQRQVCVMNTPTGTRIRQKACRTRAQWLALTGEDPSQPSAR